MIKNAEFSDKQSHETELGKGLWFDRISEGWFIRILFWIYPLVFTCIKSSRYPHQKSDKESHVVYSFIDIALLNVETIAGDTQTMLLETGRSSPPPPAIQKLQGPLVHQP